MGGRGGIVEKAGTGMDGGGGGEARQGRREGQISIGEEKGPDHHGISFPFPFPHFPTPQS